MTDRDVSASPSPPGDSSHIIKRWMLRTLLGTVVMILILFPTAGRIDWFMGWVYIAGLLLVGVLTGLLVDPGLLAERSQRRHANQAGWDRILFPIYGTVTGFMIPVFAALDERFGWSPDITAGLLFIATVIYFASWGVNIWAMMANKYFAEVARIQDDRNQKVMTGGPYRFVRHPGYTTGFFLSASMSLVLESTWGLLISIPAGLLLVLRAVLEDRMLLEELDGYKDYAQRVPYRLFPFIW